MSERTHVSEPFESEDSTPDTPPRRPSRLPLARFGNVEPGAHASHHASAEAFHQQIKPAERPNLFAFNRAAEAHAAEEAARGAAEETKRSLEAEDDDDAEVDTSVTTAELPYAEVAEEEHDHESTVPVPSSAEVADALEPQADAEHVLEDTPEDPFEKMMLAAGIDPRFAEATSGAELRDSDDAEHAPEQLDATRDPVVTHETVHTEQTVPPAQAEFTNAPPPTVPTTPRGGAGGSFPPTPPPRYSGGHEASGDDQPDPAEIMHQQTAHMRAVETTQENTVEYTDDDLHRARQDGARQGVVAGLLAGGLAGRYFANRKARKEQQKRDRDHAAELEKHGAVHAQLEQEIASLQGAPEMYDAITGQPASITLERSASSRATLAPEHTDFTEAVPRTSRNLETGSHVEAAVAAQAGEYKPDADDSEFERRRREVEKPYRKVRSEWLEVGVDKQGRVLNQEFGRAFHEEVRQEQTGAHKLTGQTNTRGVEQRQQPQSTGYYIGAPYVDPNQRLDSGQLPNEQRLPAGVPTHQDPQHLLPPAPKQLVSNILNPWFWLMLAIIAVVFFAAASL